VGGDDPGGGVVYLDDPAGLRAEQLEGFWVGWPEPPTPALHLRHLRGSDVTIVALDPATGQVVGFVTAITDGVLAAFIPTLEVLPAWQGQGIGSELVRRLLERLAGRYSVDLVCDEDLLPFYERLGLQPLPVAAGRRDPAAIRRANAVTAAPADR
jgi:ribosomal protein S18 acetylase RimI-like enzyme